MIVRHVIGSTTLLTIVISMKRTQFISLLLSHWTHTIKYVITLKYGLAVRNCYKIQKIYRLKAVISKKNNVLLFLWQAKVELREEYPLKKCSLRKNVLNP